MTEVNVKKDLDVFEISIKGHSEAERVNGADLCCCAVSMLSFTLMDSLKKLHLPSFKAYYLKGGCYISFHTDAKNVKTAQTVINTIMNGFELLKGKYPENLKIITNGGKT